MSDVYGISNLGNGSILTNGNWPANIPVPASDDAFPLPSGDHQQLGGQSQSYNDASVAEGAQALSPHNQAPISDDQAASQLANSLNASSQNSQKLDNLPAIFHALGTNLHDGAERAFDPNENGFKASLDKTGEEFSKAFDPNKNGLKASVDHTKEAFQNAFDPNKNGFKASLDKTGSEFSNAFDPNKNGLKASVDHTKEEFQNAFDPNKNGLNASIQDTKQKFEDFGEKVKHFFTGH